MDERVKNHARQKSSQLLLESRKRRSADDSVNARAANRDDMIDAEDMVVATDDQMGLERLAEQYLASQDKRRRKSNFETGGASSSKDIRNISCKKVK